MTTALADQLAAARRRSFVGRHEELELFETLLGAEGAGGVVYVHGPGGVGKSTLLRQVAWLGERTGRQVLWLDGRDTADPTRGDPLAALAGVAGVARLLLLVDTAELLGPPDHWLREDLLARLPIDAIAVLAGRDPAPLIWRVDPGWRGLVRTVTLANLDPAEGAEMLTALGVPPAEHAAALAFTHGHPLALAIVADVLAQHPGPFTPSATPQVVTALLAGLLDAVPSSRHRAALEACAQVRVTTEPLLAALLDQPDARELFDWLRDLSIMDYGSRGIFPHDLARDALGAELRWRHPDRHAEIHRRAGAYYQQQFYGADPAAQQAILSDFVYLHRDSTVLGPFVSAMTPASAGELTVGTPTGAEWPILVELVERHEGPASARVAAHWFDRQPGAVRVIRGGGGQVAGFLLMLTLEAADDADRAVDPAVDRASGYLERSAPLRAGETATMLRFWLSASDYQAMSPVQMLVALYLGRHYLTTANLAITLICYADPEFWTDASRYLDFSRIPAADFEVGGRRWGVYGHDWRVVPPLAWLGILAARETAEEPLAMASEPAAAPLRVLDADEFAAAVRAALHDLGRADRLRGSALLRSRLVIDRSGADTSVAARVPVIQEVIREAAAALEASPRDLRAFRALHHTYLQPAATQQRAADLLKLPMSTFRRHLAAGIERITEILWEREVAG